MTSTEDKPAAKLAPWLKPTPESVVHDPQLRIMNSLTRQKDHFLTSDGTNKVTWYM